MQIVINILKEVYDRVLKAKSTPDVLGIDIVNVINAVKNGTPLPEGHGRIGDLDALREEVSSWGMNDYEPSDFTDAIDQADTIIPTDKEKNPSTTKVYVVTQDGYLYGYGTEIYLVGVFTEKKKAEKAASAEKTSITEIQLDKAFPLEERSLIGIENDYYLGGYIE